MKKIINIPILMLFVLLSGCFEIVQESDINSDGSGVYSNKIDLSSLIGMLSMLGGDEAKKMAKEARDTTILLSSFKDSLSDLSDKEKQLIEKASLNVVFNAADEKFFLTFYFPYSKPADVNIINGLLRKTTKKVISRELASMSSGDSVNTNMIGMGDGGGMSVPDLDEYFDIMAGQGKLVKKLNAGKYPTAANDKGLKSLQEMGKLGSPFTFKTIFHLPKPAKKAEGKNVKLSGDKKQITIEATIDDFFDDPSKLEYLIEY